MSQLKPSFMAEIFASLEKSRFTKDDFQVEFPKSGLVLVRITFSHLPKYSLSLTDRTLPNGPWSVRAIPGDYKLEDQIMMDSIEGFLEVVDSWCENIRDDLYAIAPRQPDPLEALRRKLQGDLDNMVQEPDGYFTEEEVRLVDTRFDELFADVARLKEEYSLTKQQLDEIRRELNEIKASARAYPKGIWARITGNKLVKTLGGVANSAEGRKFLFDQLKQLISGPG